MSFLDHTATHYRSERFTAGLLLGKALAELFPKVEILDMKIGDVDLTCRCRLPHRLDADAQRVVEEKVRQSIGQEIPVQSMEMLAENAAAMLAERGQRALSRSLKTYKGMVLPFAQVDGFTGIAWDEPVDHTGLLGEFKILEVSDRPLERGIELHLTACVFPNRYAVKEFVKARKEAQKRNPERLAMQKGWGECVDREDGGRSWVWQNDGVELLNQLRQWVLKDLRSLGYASVITRSAEVEDQWIVNGDRAPTEFSPPDLPSSMNTVLEWKRGSHFDQDLEGGLWDPAEGHHMTVTLKATQRDAESRVTSLLQWIAKISKILGLEAEFFVDDRRQQCQLPRKQWMKYSEISRRCMEKAAGQLGNIDEQCSVPPFGPEIRVIWRDWQGRRWLGSRLAWVMQGSDDNCMVFGTLFGSAERLLALALEQSNGELPEVLAQ